jgi:hypothetical protein
VTTVGKLFGVAWFGRTAKVGICMCCQKARPVYDGYNGGQAMAVTVCAACRNPQHPICQD